MSTACPMRVDECEWRTVDEISKILLDTKKIGMKNRQSVCRKRYTELETDMREKIGIRYSERIVTIKNFLQSHHFFERKKILYVKKIGPRILLAQFGIGYDHTVPLRSGTDMLHHVCVPKDYYQQCWCQSANNFSQ